MRRLVHKYLFWIFRIALISTLTAGICVAQHPNSQIAYLLSLDETGWRSCRVSITIENNRQEQLIFALSDWLPGYYSRFDAAAKIQNFKIEGELNKRLPFEQLSRNRWLVDTQEQSVLRVTYDVQIQENEVPSHKLDANGALINCGMVFMSLENHRNLPAFVRLIAPETWKVATSLRPTSYLNEFVAKNYDELIDSPILIGDFQDFYFRHQEKTINVVINQFNNQQIDRFLGTLRKIVRTQSQIFTSLPFESYIFLCELQPAAQIPQATGYGNACVLQFPVSAISQKLNDFAPLVAREFFRIWNGKRIRPVTARIGKATRLPQTNLLWFSEGFTQYYGDLTMVRGKIWSEVQYLEQIGQRIARLKENPNNEKITVNAASLAEWETDNSDLTEFYENRGYLLALVLDLNIRQITNNKSSLDDVFQLMNWWFAKADLPYSQQDVLNAVNAVCHSDFTRFFERYINGTQDLPVEEQLRFVGFRPQISRTIVADWGELPILNPKNQVIKISNNSRLTRAGLEKGDQILAIDSVKVKTPTAFFETATSRKENSEIQLLIQRNRVSSTLRIQTGQKFRYRCAIKNLPEPIPQQIQNRQLWLQIAETSSN